MTIANITMPQSTPAGRTSKYFDELAGIAAGTDQCVVAEEIMDLEKAARQLQAAIQAYRKRTGDRVAFSVRKVMSDGIEVMAAWKLPHEVRAKQPKAAA